LTSAAFGSRPRQVQISSRNPENPRILIEQGVDAKSLLPAVPVDITKPSTLAPAFDGADVVVSLVGIMHGTHTCSGLAT